MIYFWILFAIIAVFAVAIIGLVVASKSIDPTADGDCMQKMERGQ